MQGDALGLPMVPDLVNSQRWRLRWLSTPLACKMAQVCGCPSDAAAENEDGDIMLL